MVTFVKKQDGGREMLKIVKRLCVSSVFVTGFCVCLLESVSAHTMWLNVTKYSPKMYKPREGTPAKYTREPGARSTVYFGWGHEYPVEGFLTDKHLGELVLVSPKGEKEKLTPGEGGFRATQIKMKKEGGWIAAATIKPGFYGKVESKPEAKGEFWKMRYAQCAKALINAGEVSGNPFLKPVGHEIEIIPLKNPNQLKLGDWFPFKVLFDGKPAKRAEIHAASLFSSTDESFTAHTNNNGEAKIRLLHYGPWIVKAKLQLPPTEEFKDKCKELRYTATLTFEAR
ncbi:MAG: DUF4198 domain-containing protein [Candidatus Omnitrophica bacterium]|nr:DUF4198 domain-containing protein [Candidatus Omnitrophota bacterium]